MHTTSKSTNSKSGLLAAHASRKDTLGQRLRARREQIGLTLDQAAAETCTKKAYLGKLENDDFNEPSPETLARIAVRYELDVQEILEIAGYRTLSAIASNSVRTQTEVRHVFDGDNLTPMEASELRRYLGIVRFGMSAR
jgi:transcriptional regulator with XRE-family HTH domain